MAVARTGEPDAFPVMVEMTFDSLFLSQPATPIRFKSKQFPRQTGRKIKRIEPSIQKSQV